MKGFTEIEKAVLEKILEGNHPILAELRFQLSKSRVVRREFTGVGFFTEIKVNKDVEIKFKKNIYLSDVHADIKGMKYGAAFVLYVNNGVLSMLEGCSYDEAWPENITEFKLSYLAGETRDWDKLKKELE